MIKRIWHGWTTPEDAVTYENLLKNEVFASIEAQNISGFREIELLRRELDTEVEFVTIMSFDSLKSVIDFQGQDYQRCYVPDAAKKLLKRWDQESQHFELAETRNYAP